MRQTPVKSQSQQLAERIRRRIERSKLSDGALFMTEAEVAEEYGVSRTVAREAVGRLRTLGLLEGRQRKGLIVRRPDPVKLFSATLPSLAQSKEDLIDVTKLRYALEVGAVELAVKNATEDQIHRLVGLAAEIKVAVQAGGSPSDERDLDLAFHSLLLEMTGSTLIAEMQRVLVQFFRSLSTRVADAASADRIAWEHTELASAIRDRDVERARAMIRVQVGRYLNDPDHDPVPQSPSEPPLKAKSSSARGRGRNK